jgi:2-desacetyl-2-hydroxyethyl bacteriochlorophyllide A dehydrogenase
MRAIVIDRPHEIELREVQGPRCGASDVLIRSHKVGVCRTDIKILRGQMPPSLVRYPCIPGHEWSGTVVDVGTEVLDLAAGDRVIAEGRIPCRRCPSCRAGETNLCTSYDQLGFTRPGGYGELVVAPSHVVHRLPDHVSLDTGVLIEPAACVLRGLTRADPKPGCSIGVVGVGALGSISVALARLFSPHVIVAYGIRDVEMRFAEDLGVDQAITAAEGDPEGETRRLLPNGPDVVVEAAGTATAVELATRLVRPGGTVVLLGSSGEGVSLQLPADRFMRKDMTLIGNLSYTTSIWTRMLRLAVDGVVNLDRLVAQHVPIRRFEDALRMIDQPQGAVARIVLEHDPSHEADHDLMS